MSELSARGAAPGLANRRHTPVPSTMEVPPIMTDPTTARAGDPGPRDGPYSAEQMTRMLNLGAEQIDRYPVYAAVHLLTFTELVGRADFAKLVDLETVDAGGGAVRAAFVRDWTALPIVSGLGGAGRRLLLLAAGMRVDLAESLSGLGHAHARRVVEAIAIATGHGEFGDAR